MSMAEHILLESDSGLYFYGSPSLHYQFLDIFLAIKVLLS